MKLPRWTKYLRLPKARVKKMPRCKKKNLPTADHKRRWSAIIELGCIVPTMHECHGRLTIHHCFTGAGGRKQHSKTICLCWNMHLGPDGIDGQKLSKRQWQEKYGSEAVLLSATEEKLRRESNV